MPPKMPPHGPPAFTAPIHLKTSAPTPQPPRSPTPPRLVPRAGLRAFRDFPIPRPGGSAGGAGRDDGAARRFEPFDGSLPLLPPFRPATPEADFARHGERVRGRERAAREAREARRVVSLLSGGDRLYAEMVQEAGVKDGKVWLRPLMLHVGEGGGRREDEERDGESYWMDLRQTSDVLLPKEAVCMEPVEPARKVVLDMTLAAAEKDLYKRVVDMDDGVDLRSHRAALAGFIQSLFTDRDD